MNKILLFLVALSLTNIAALITSDLSVVQSAQAEATNEVIVKDSSGFVRAQTAVEGTGTIEFTVVDEKGDKKDGAVLTLLNEATGETITGNTVAGVAIFEGITPGIWVISTTTPGIVFTNVVITVGGLAGAAGGGLTGGTLLAVGGITVAGAAGIAISNSNDDNNDQTPISPSS